MEEPPRQMLCEIIGTYGRTICDDQRRCESLLRDKCGAYRREIFVLMSALRERVAVDLQVSSQGTPIASVLARLTQRLEDNLALTSPAARWAVESWALALGLLTSQELTSLDAPLVTPTTRGPQRRGWMVLSVGLSLLLAIGAVVVTHWLHTNTRRQLEAKLLAAENAQRRPGDQRSQIPKEAQFLQVEKERDQARTQLRQAEREREQVRTQLQTQLQQAERDRDEARAQRQQAEQDRDHVRMLLQQALAVREVPPSPSPSTSGPRAPSSGARADAATLPLPIVPPQVDIGTAQHDIQQMLTYAMANGGMDNETEITAAKRRMEARTPLRTADPGARRQARAANEQGRRALQESRVGEALQAFQGAYKADPTDAEITNNLAYAYLYQGDLETAESWLLRALVLSPGRAMAWANLGHVYAAQGNLQVAVACFANAYRFAVSKETMRKSLEALARDNQNDQVREAASQALRLQLVQARVGQ